MVLLQCAPQPGKRRAVTVKMSTLCTCVISQDGYGRMEQSIHSTNPKIFDLIIILGCM